MCTCPNCNAPINYLKKRALAKGHTLTCSHCRSVLRARGDDKCGSVFPWIFAGAALLGIVGVASYDALFWYAVLGFCAAVLAGVLILEARSFHLEVMK